MRNSIANIQISPTNDIKEKIKLMEQSGQKIIRLDTIETNLETPDNIKIAAIKAINENYTKYTAYSGSPELKSVVCQMLLNKYGISYASQANCLISCGSKQALFNSIFSLLNPGDEAIIFAPYWETYIEQVKIAEGVPIIVETEESDNFEPTREQIEQAISPRTKIIIINSPSNPTGRVYGEVTLKLIAEIAKTHNLYIVSDETMANFTYGHNQHVPIASMSKDTFQRTLTIGSASKDYSMSGFRIGFVCGSSVIIETMSMLQAQITANPVSFAQIAAIEAWSGDQTSLQETLNELNKRKFILEQGLSEIGGFVNYEGQGAVFTFPNISHYIGTKILGKTIHNAQDFCDVILQESVALVPGNYFGEKYKNNIRVSFSCSTQQEIQEAIQKMKTLLQSKNRRSSVA